MGDTGSKALADKDYIFVFTSEPTKVTGVAW
jgi:hypothetical protein